MSSKKLRFRGDINFQNRIDELLDEVDGAGGGGVGIGHRRPSASTTFTNQNKDISDSTTKTTKEEETPRGKLKMIWGKAKKNQLKKE